MYKLLSTVIISLFAVFQIIGQDLSIHMMDSIYTRMDVNPAYRFEKKIVIDLPGFIGGVYTNGIGITDLLIENNGINELKLREGIENVNDTNYITGETSVSLIGVGFSLGNLQISTGYNWHYLGSMTYTKDAFLLAANGNAPYIGQTLDVGPELLLQSYHELYLGGSYKMDNLTLGGRVKLLSGINDISTESASVQLRTEEEIYQLNVKSDYVLNTTGLIDYNGINDVDINTDELSDDLFANFMGDNSGIAFDLGVDWKVNDKVNLSASILDLGSINWNKNVTNYTSKSDNVFEGVDILDYIDDDQEVVLEDSLYNLLEFKESSEEYSTKLGAKIHISARYQYNSRLTIGANYMKSNNTINSRYLFSLNSQFKAVSWLSLGGGYGITTNNPMLIPFNVMMHLGYFDLYMSTDNILSAFAINSSRASSLRLGLQFGF